MTTPQLGYWAVTLSRAMVALISGLIVTFLADHSPVVGFVVVGAFAVASGVVLFAGVVASPLGPPRRVFAVEGAIFVVVGIIAITLRGDSAASLLFLGCFLFGVTGVFELTVGLTAKNHPARGEWIFAGSVSALLALVALVVPATFVQHFTGPDGVHRSLTASVVFVGAFGAYAVILGVYLAIAGLSQYWSRATATDTTQTATTKEDRG